MAILRKIKTIKPKADRPKRKRREDRFDCSAHRAHIRRHACVKCGHDVRGEIVVAHVRNGSDGGMSKKPSDYHGVPLCDPCHKRQHDIGEASFWGGRDVERIKAELIATSPKRREIEEFRRERGEI